MHETIMQFPSDWFYHGELEAAPEVRYRGIFDFDTPMNWIDTVSYTHLPRCCAENTISGFHKVKGDKNKQSNQAHHPQKQIKSIYTCLLYTS